MIQNTQALRQSKPELVCPAGSMPALQAAVDHGADCVYVGLKGSTNARNLPGINFTLCQLKDAVRYAQTRDCGIVVCLNSYVTAGAWDRWQATLDGVAALAIKGVMLSDPALMAYCVTQYPHLDIQVSVQASGICPEALTLYQHQFNAARVVLPRVLAWQHIQHLAASTTMPLGVFGFGGLCVMADGQCQLSSFSTGHSIKQMGACSPPSAVRWQQTPTHLDAYLGEWLIDRFSVNELTNYPLVCKGRYVVQSQTYPALEEPTTINSLAKLPQIIENGIAAIYIEGRQRSPAYVAKLTQIWRSAIDRCMEQDECYSKPHWNRELALLTEGVQQELGTASRPWPL